MEINAIMGGIVDTALVSLGGRGVLCGVRREE